MNIENSWIRFTENGERITGKKGRIKKNRNDKLYFEIEVENEGILRINVNDYLSNRINHLDAEYVTIICKDHTRNFVDVVEADVPILDSPSDAFEEVASHLRRKEVILSLARLIDLRKQIEYTDDVVEDKLSDLYVYIEQKL